MIKIIAETQQIILLIIAFVGSVIFLVAGLKLKDRFSVWVSGFFAGVGASLIKKLLE